MNELTRYAVWDQSDHVQDIGGKWAKAVEAEAALAENDREWREIADSLQAESDANFADAERAEARIKELEAGSNAWQHHLSLARAREVKLKARLQAAEALAEQVTDYFTGRPDGEDLLFAADAFREAGQPNQEVDA